MSVCWLPILTIFGAATDHPMEYRSSSSDWLTSYSPSLRQQTIGIIIPAVEVLSLGSGEDSPPSSDR